MHVGLKVCQLDDIDLYCEAREASAQLGRTLGAGVSGVGSGLNVGMVTGVAVGGRPIGNSNVVVVVQDHVGLSWVGPCGLPRTGFSVHCSSSLLSPRRIV